MTRKTALILLLPFLAVSLPVLLALASRSEPERRLGGPPEMAEAQNASRLSPAATVEQTMYNFGILDPLTESTHSFTIRNDGDAPLELTAGSTTCKCTLSEISRPVIPPGESGQVRLMWNTGSKYTFYSHGATIYTNDPHCKTLDLQIQGTVRVQLGATTPDLLFDGIEPDSSKSVSTWLYSQVWDSLTVERVDCSHLDIQWDLELVDPAEVSELKAKSAYRITVTVPAGLPEGYLHEVLTCVVRPDGGDPQSLELTLAGKVLRRLSLYGPGIDQSGELDLGNTVQGRGLHRCLVVKVRDSEAELALQAIEVSPDFLDIQLTPYQTDSQATGLYHLDVRVPPSASAANYRGTRKGHIKLLIDHPRISDLKIPVSFAVVGER